jgi:hypothetical protein
MPILPFPEWRPDLSDLNAQYTRVVRNVVPRLDGYGPFQDHEPFTDALPAACRGYFAARTSSGSVRIFAGTETRLYMLDNTTLAWSDVSQGGSAYAALDTGANWVFAQFGDFVIATQKNEPMQYYDLATPTAFADLAGSPPQAGWIAVVGSFLVAADLLSEPYRIQWSGLNDVTEWTSGTNRSDFQDLPDGGRVRCVIEMSSDVALILQEESARRMTYQPGSAVVFRIDRLQSVPGILSPYSAVSTLGGVYYFSPHGFVRVTADGAITNIGEEKIDRTILGQLPLSAPAEVLELGYDEGTFDNMVGAVDPRTNIIIWAYKRSGSSNDYFDQGLLYSTALDRWAPIDLECEYLASVARPGITLEGLDELAPGYTTISNAVNNGSGLIRLTVSSTSGFTTGDFKTIAEVGGVPNANGTFLITVINGTTMDLQGSTFAGTYTSGGYVAGSLDALEFSLDAVSNSTVPSIGAVDVNNQLGFFSGSNTAAALETAEQMLAPRRIFVNGFWPITDTTAAIGSVVTRDNLGSQTEAEGTAGTMQDDGFIPLLDEGRYVRGRLTIPAATSWSFVTGIEPDVKPVGGW